MARVPLSRPLGWDSRSPLRSLLCSMHFMGAPQPCTPPRPADIQGSLERAAPVQAAGVDWGSEWGLALLPKSGESLHRTPARAGLTPSKCRQAHRQGGGGVAAPPAAAQIKPRALTLRQLGPSAGSWRNQTQLEAGQTTASPLHASCPGSCGPTEMSSPTTTAPPNSPAQNAPRMPEKSGRQNCILKRLVFQREH